MKYNTLFSILCLVLFFTACKKEEIAPKVNEDGLTKEITDLVPQSILDEMAALGMPINGGANPPILEDTYLASPFILLSSNRPGDSPGNSFAAYQVTFSGQDNDELTLMVDYENGGERGTGIGSFIVGEGCEFSVFVEVNSTYSGASAKLTHVISGELQGNGIKDLHFANFMLDNNGNPQGVWIENGEGRVLHDSDGFSQKLGTNAQWHAVLPNCPCEYDEDLDGKEEMCGTWEDFTDGCAGVSFLDKFHFGAAYEIRWAKDEANPGQQCTYDASKQLITGGIAAGTPDKYGVTGVCSPNSDHTESDVDPWYEMPCAQYLNEWPPNTGTAICGDNVVHGFEHMAYMVRNMNCEEITTIIKTAKTSPNLLIDAELRSFLIGEILEMSTTELIFKLENWKARKSCNLFPNDDFCLLLDKAIANLQ